MAEQRPHEHQQNIILGVRYHKLRKESNQANASLLGMFSSYRIRSATMLRMQVGKAKVAPAADLNNIHKVGHEIQHVFVSSSRHKTTNPSHHLVRGCRSTCVTSNEVDVTKSDPGRRLKSTVKCGPRALTEHLPRKPRLLIA